jgi:hypothetical protein
MIGRISPTGGGARKILLAVIAILAGCAPFLEAGNVLPSLGFSRDSGVSMKLTSFYENIPPCGYLPLRVEVKNDGGSARQWTLRTVHAQSGFSTVSFVTELRVEARSESTFDLMVPLSTQGQASSRYSNLQILVSGPGVTDGSSSLHSPGRSGSLTPYLGMGEELSIVNWARLEDLLKKKGSRTLDGTTLDSKMLPSDWRGLAGFQIILFTAAEWRSIAPGPRSALLDWVAQGGRRILGYDGAAGPADLPAAGGLGTGSIEHLMLGNELLAQLDKILDGGTDSMAEISLRNYSWQWKLAKEIGRPEPPKLLILLFVIAFGVIVGPVNFFVFAPAGNRSRLFWTTPLISIAASALMGVFILLAEGLGGHGNRFVAMLSLADQNKTVVWQEQVSRTGVLLGSSFVPGDPTALLLPIRLSDGGSGYRPWQDRSQAFSLAGDRWSGDWFRSRRTQAQALMVVTPSRGQFAFGAAPDGTPTVVSTFDKEMADLWYFDQTGGLWTASKIAPGEKVSLVRGEPRAFDTWLSKALTPAGALTRERVQGFAKSERAGKFLAAAPTPSLIATLPAIRWSDAGGIVFGRVTP